MKNFPIIEVVMAVYNGCNHLEEQVKSIRNQSYMPYKLIVRDDCSSDQSLDILYKLSTNWPGWMKVIQGTQRLGCKKNFEYLLNVTEADYIALADQDDIWDPEKLEICIKYCLKIENQSNTRLPVLIHSDLRLINYKGDLIANSFIAHEGINPYANNLNQLFIKNVITGCSVLINRKVIDNSLPFPKEAILHDWWLGLVTSKLGHIYFIPKQLASYRQHNMNSLGVKGKGCIFYLKRLISFLDLDSLRNLFINYILQSKSFFDFYGGEEPFLLKLCKSNTWQRIIHLSKFNSPKNKGCRYIAFLYLLFICLSFRILSDHGSRKLDFN